MRRRHAQAGEGKLGCILWALLLAIVILVGWKAIPVKVASSELYDFMVEQAKWAQGASEESLQKAIFAEAKRLDLPVDIARIKAVKSEGRVRMSAAYTVPLEFPGYTYDWNFNLEVDRPIFQF